METIGIKDNPLEINLVNKLSELIKLNGERFEVNLPWKKFPSNLLINFDLSVGRLRTVICSFKGKPELLKKVSQNPYSTA